MAILAFQKPDKVLMLEADSRFGKFEFRPLEPGFGITVGNALRRILLSSLEGFAINTIKIEGVEHEFASVPGVKEDVTNIILNLKQVRFKQVVEEFENEKVSITVENSSEFKAGDISKYLTGFEVLNPELVICHLDSKATLQMDITINKGRGYVPADENREYCTDVNVIPIDSIYTPIRNVKYQVENFRVEQKTDYEKLILEITTDGSIHPYITCLKFTRILMLFNTYLFISNSSTTCLNQLASFKGHHQSHVFFNADRCELMFLPSILIVIANPSNERIRRKRLTVMPKPGSSGRNSNFPNLESLPTLILYQVLM